MRIESSYPAAGGGVSQSSDNSMARTAPAHVDTLRWNLADAGERNALLLDSSHTPPPDSADDGGITKVPTDWGGIVLGTGQGFADADRSLTQRGTQLATQGQGLLSESADIFKKYPAQFLQRWEFTTSAVTNKGVVSQPLVKYLDQGGILHNAEKPNAAPLGSVANANAQAATANGVKPKPINIHNGDVAEDAIEAKWRARGYDVQRKVLVDTPLGRREVDILATKNVGHPTLSEEIRVESKVGSRSLPAQATGSNVRRQADKDIAALADRHANAPAAQARGHSLHAACNSALDKGSALAKAGAAANTVGKSARPVGAVMTAFEIGGAFKADGNKVGVNTMGKVAGLAGGAGGAWAGAAAGAALGSVVPGVGTVIGGVVGGIVGGLAGEAVVSKAFDAVKGWFS